MEQIKSVYIIEVFGDEFIKFNTQLEARRRFKSLVSGNNTAFLYRKDYDSKGKLIDTYLLSFNL